MGSAGAVLTAIGRNVSFLGKTWWLLMVALRLVLILLAGFTLFSDEQERFVCNTIQPGCANVCFNLLAPVSLFRLWLLHLLLLCLPHLLLATHFAHRLLRDPDQDPDPDRGAGHAGGRQGGSPCSSLDIPQLLLLHYHQHPHPPHLHHRGGQDAAERLRSAPGFRGAYLLAVAARTLLEAGLAAGHFLFFGLAVPPSFLCYEAPCASGVQCYVSRPTEKTLMLRLMLGLACLSVALSLAELAGGARAALQRRRRRRETAAAEEEMSKGEQSSAFSSLSSSEESHLLLNRKTADGFESDVKAAPCYAADRAPSAAVVAPRGVADEKASPWKHNGNSNGAAAPAPAATAAKPRAAPLGPYVLHAQQDAAEHASPDRSPAQPGWVPCTPAGARGPGSLGPPAGSASGSRKNSTPSEAPDKRAWV